MRGEASVFRFHEGANRSPECNPFHKRGAWEPTLRLQLVENGGCLPFAGWYEMCQQLHRSRPSFGSWNFHVSPLACDFALSNLVVVTCREHSGQEPGRRGTANSRAAVHQESGSGGAARGCPTHHVTAELRTCPAA